MPTVCISSNKKLGNIKKAFEGSWVKKSRLPFENFSNVSCLKESPSCLLAAEKLFMVFLLHGIDLCLDFLYRRAFCLFVSTKASMGLLYVEVLFKGHRAIDSFDQRPWSKSNKPCKIIQNPFNIIMQIPSVYKKAFQKLQSI